MTDSCIECDKKEIFDEWDKYHNHTSAVHYCTSCKSCQALSLHCVS